MSQFEEEFTLPRHSHLSAKPIESAYTTRGNENSNKVLLLIHGWGCQASDYFPVMDELVRGNNREESELPYFILAPDLPGHGNSPATEPTIEAFTGILRLLIQKYDEAVLIGHSMGVRIVVALWDTLRKEQEWVGGEVKAKPIVRALVFIDGSHYALRPTLFAFDKGDPRSKELCEEEIAAKKKEAFNSMFSARTPDAFREKTTLHVKNMDKTFSDSLRDSMIQYDKEHMKARIEAFGAYQHQRHDAGKRGPVFMNFQSSNPESGKRLSMKQGDWQSHQWMQFLESATRSPKQIVIQHSMHFPHVDWPGPIGEDLRAFIRDEVGWV